MSKYVYPIKYPYFQADFQKFPIYTHPTDESQDYFKITLKEDLKTKILRDYLTKIDTYYEIILNEKKQHFISSLKESFNKKAINHLCIYTTKRLNYDINECININKLKDEFKNIDLECPICFEIFNDPLKLACDHTFCKTCVEKIYKNKIANVISCPLCRSPSNTNGDIKMNLSVSKAINKMIMNCKKCNIVHNINNCSHQLIKCKHCDKEMKKSEFVNHLQKENIIMKCNTCNNYVYSHQIETHKIEFHKDNV